MFVYFAKNLYTSLIKENFTLIPHMYDNPKFDNSTKYMGLSKIKGSVLYVVIIINLDCITLKEFDDFFANYRMDLEKMNMRKILIYNILSSSSIDDDTKLFTECTSDFLDQELLNLYWIVDTTTNEVYSKEKDNFIDIESHIQNGLNGDDSLIVSESFRDIRRKGISLNSVSPVTNKNVVVICLILISVTLTLSMQMSGGSQDIDVLIQHGALVPNRVFYNHEYFRLLTTTFLHANILHLLINGLYLYVFGSLTEKYFGVPRFVIIYLFSGFMSSLLTLFFVDAVSVGASGAIFGLMGSVLAITHKTGKSVSRFSSYTLILCILSTIGLSFFMPNIGHVAHISGLITGYIFGLALYKPLENLES